MIADLPPNILAGVFDLLSGRDLVHLSHALVHFDARAHLPDGYRWPARQVLHRDRQLPAMRRILGDEHIALLAERRISEACCQCFLNGELHLDNGPAVVYYSGVILHEYYLHGRRHNERGPAVLRRSGTQEWWFCDMLHRADGPAIVRTNPTRNTETVEEFWFMGKQHCTTGPAVRHVSHGIVAVERYMVHGVLHRAGEPASITRDAQGTVTHCLYYEHGKLHRRDGPAVVIVDGVYRREEHWWKGMRHNLYGPARIDSTRHGTDYEYWAYGERTRVDGPAIVRHLSNNVLVEEYYLHGLRHRIPTGPAVTYSSQGASLQPYGLWHALHGTDVLHGAQEWWVHGINIGYGPHPDSSRVQRFANSALTSDLFEIEIEDMRATHADAHTDIAEN